MASLNIKVGASVDRNLQTAFRPLVEGAKRAAATVQNEARKAAAAQEREAKRAAATQARELGNLQKTNEKVWKAYVRDQENAAREAQRAHERSEREKTRATQREQALRNREQEQSLREHKRALARQDRQYGRDNAWIGANGAGVSAGLSRAGRVGMGIAKAGVGAAYRLGTSYARGLGVDTDVGSLFTKNAELETMAAQLANSGYIAGDKRNGQRVDSRALMSQALSVGKETGTDANQALEGLIKFTGKTGDLATGREIMKDLATYAKATGTQLDDMVDAAGDVATALPESANKGQEVLAVMRAIAGQGKLGAVEIRDLASQMAKLAANAGQIEGKTSENIVLLGAFAQEARQKGGAASATQAATSVASLMNTFKTPARAHAFEAATGKKVFNKQGMVRNPEELVMEALRAKGMDPEGFKKVFANVQGARAVEGFATIYRQAGGGQAGEEAVRAEFDRLKKAVVTNAEIMDSFALQMKTGQSQAEVFNNSLRETALKLHETLLPAAVNLAPVLLDMAQKGASVVSWLVGHEASLKKQDDANAKDIENAVKNTHKQLGNGEILEGQQEINKQAELEAHRIYQQRQGDADLARKQSGDTYDKAVRLGNSVQGYTPGGALANWIMGKDIGKEANNRDEAKLDDKVQQAKDAREKWEEISGTNKRVADLLRDHVIKVKVMEPVPGGTNAPNTPGEGRQPTPEEKAKR